MSRVSSLTLATLTLTFYLTFSYSSEELGLSLGTAHYRAPLPLQGYVGKTSPGLEPSVHAANLGLSSLHLPGDMLYTCLVASFHDLQGKGCFTPQRHRACFRAWCIVVSCKFLEKQVSKHEEETTIKIKERKKQPGSKGSF